jgi:ABC-type enterochelin transport system permease subunit
MNKTLPKPDSLENTLIIKSWKKDAINKLKRWKQAQLAQVSESRYQYNVITKSKLKEISSQQMNMFTIAEVSKQQTFTGESSLIERSFNSLIS